MMEKLSTGENPKQLAAKLLESLKPWEIEQGKADFMQHLYDTYDRKNAEPPLQGTFTGLWQEFLKDAAFLYRANFIKEATIKRRSNQ